MAKKKNVPKKQIPNVIDLSNPRHKINEQLQNLVVAKAAADKMPLERVVQLILNDVLGNDLVDDELEENIVITVAKTFGGTTKNSQHDINGDGDDDDLDDDDDLFDDDDEEDEDFYDDDDFDD